MVLVDYWWRRYRLALIFVGLALALGTVIGALTGVVLALPPRAGSRPEFYIELFLAAVVALALVMVLFARPRAGLPIVLAIVAFLPSRSGMQLGFAGYAIISAVDAAVLLGFIVLVWHTKVIRKERWQPVAVRGPLWIWTIMAPLGMLVALARHVSWVNWAPELKGFFFWMLIVVLCVNVVRTRFTLRAIMLALVLSAIPNVIQQLHDAGVSGQGTTSLTAQLANGVTVHRVAGGGAGLLNQYAFYIMAVFFITVGMAFAFRSWPLRLFFYGCAALLVAGIISTYTRGAWIGTVIGLLVLALAGGRRMVAGVATGAAISYFLIPSWVWGRLNFHDNSVAERVGFLHTALAAIRDNPLLGGGWGSNYVLVGNVVVPDFTRGDIPFWHDDYLVVATQVGLPGLALFVLMLASIFWVTARAYLRAPQGELRIYLLAFLAAMAAMCVQAFTDMFFWRNETGPLIWLIVGLICATINLIRDEEQVSAPVAPPSAGQLSAVPVDAPRM